MPSTAAAVHDLVQIAFRQFGGTDCDSIILRGKKVMLETETTIDKSYDQTAEHVHVRGVPCPTCKSYDCVGANPKPITYPVNLSPHVSPAILEHRIERLEQELKAEKQSHGITTAERDVARSRVKQFERFNAEISVKVDEMLERLAIATGENPITILYPNYDTAA